VWSSGVLQQRKVDTLIARAAADAWGVLSLAELRACGLSDEALRVRVRNGWLHRIHRGVYAVGHAGLTPEGRWLAAVKACGPHAVLSHHSAATLFGLERGTDRRPEVTIPATAKYNVPGIRVHRTRRLHTNDARRHKGILVTTAARLILDLSATESDLNVRRLMSRAKSEYLTNTRLLGQQIDRSAGKAGRARFARVLASAPPETRSELEDRVFDLILAGGFQRPDVNRPLHIDGRTVIPDFRWPAQRLIVEADGARWHDPILDAERQAFLEAYGGRVVRVSWEQSTAATTQTLQRFARAGAPTSRARP
jgi:very-short-patch-repair endonuclease